MSSIHVRSNIPAVALGITEWFCEWFAEAFETAIIKEYKLLKMKQIMESHGNVRFMKYLEQHKVDTNVPIVDIIANFPRVDRAIELEAVTAWMNYKSFVYTRCLVFIERERRRHARFWEDFVSGMYIDDMLTNKLWSTIDPLAQRDALLQRKFSPWIVDIGT